MQPGGNRAQRRAAGRCSHCEHWAGLANSPPHSPPMLSRSTVVACMCTAAVLASCVTAFTPPGLPAAVLRAPHARARHARLMAGWATAATAATSGSPYTVNPIDFGAPARACVLPFVSPPPYSLSYVVLTWQRALLVAVGVVPSYDHS
jgi:hypothetical protein